ncbi:MAG TPA: ABC transporter substrate-binding protein [Azospirillaceae bacterium]|nr:ABC transporter substrate-binding protein [Azospirillaceae bacterium]
MRALVRTLLAAWLLAPLPAAPAHAEELRIGLAALANTVDPHHHNLFQNNELAAHVFEPLVARDASLRPVPRLAAEWRREDARNWVFRLRPGVRFHDGRGFAARDVIYSFCRAAKPRTGPGGFIENLSEVVSAEARDPLTLVVRTRGPDPMLPRVLSNIAILPAPAGFDGRYDAKGCAAPGWPERDAFDSLAAAIGTGPYRISRYEAGRGAVLDRFEGYWGAKPAWNRVVLHLIADGTLRSRALMMGEVDVISNPEPSTLGPLSARPDLTLTTGPSTAVAFLQMDWVRETAPGGVTGTHGQNPFRDIRVRRAVSLAVGREELVNRVQRGSSEPTAQLLPPGLPGYDPEIPVPAYDRDRARALLTEAGYADGFSVQLAGVEANRKVMEVLAYFLGTVGIRAEVLALPSQEFFERMSRGEFGLYYAGRISITGELTNQVVPLLAARDPARGRGLNNPYGILLPEMEQLLDRAEATADDAEREGLLREIARLIDREQAIVPLYLQQGRWALRRDIRLTPRMDRHTIAMEIAPGQ